MTDLDAPIVAVTVFPDRARITRRGTAILGTGEQKVTFGPLPLALVRDSVRVAGHGSATVLGVDVLTRRKPQSAEADVLEIEERLREIETSLGELDDADAVATARERFLNRVATRAASGFSEVTRAGQFADDVDQELLRVKQGRRERQRQRELLAKEKSAAERRLADLRGDRVPDVLVAQVSLDVAQEGELELELSYLTTGAGWHSTYDLRLAADRLALSWFGLIMQHTGEHWPECELKLSTARPSGALDVPELDPWYIDRLRPLPRPHETVLAGAVAMSAPAAAPMARMAKVVEEVATVEHGQTSATYTPSRPVAVPSDGTAHRTLVAQLEFEARLDHVTAPVIAEEATLRATVRNSSQHTLPEATAALFHEGDFVGSAHVEAWAPEEERELALGVDDRVRVERELLRRNATKPTLGTSRRVEAEYQITVANHSPRPIHLTVLDQLPVSRDAQIVVKETVVKPDPVERTDLGVVTWKAELETGARAQFHLGFRVETPKGVDLAGWRD